MIGERIIFEGDLEEGDGYSRWVRRVQIVRSSLGTLLLRHIYTVPRRGRIERWLFGRDPHEGEVRTTENQVIERNRAIQIMTDNGIDLDEAERRIAGGEP